MFDLPPESQWRTADGIQCFECGEWKRALGNHLRLGHKITADDYRRKWGLRQRQPLTCGEVSERRRRIAVDTGGVERMTALIPTTLVAAQVAARGRERRPQERASVSDLGKRQGRKMKVKAADRVARAHVRILSEGFPDRRSWLAAHYVDGLWSIQRCAKHLDLPVGTVQAWMREDGIQSRPTGPVKNAPR